mgnify:CR=1 FL=1
MITAEQVKELREKTGAGMMDCKKVLTETNGDEEKAIELVKKEWGEDSSVYFDLAGVTSDGKYRKQQQGW